jgi:hypothetical protein
LVYGWERFHTAEVSIHPWGVFFNHEKLLMFIFNDCTNFWQFTLLDLTMGGFSIAPWRRVAADNSCAMFVVIAPYPILLGIELWFKLYFGGNEETAVPKDGGLGSGEFTY